MEWVSGEAVGCETGRRLTRCEEGSAFNKAREKDGSAMDGAKLLLRWQTLARTTAAAVTHCNATALSEWQLLDCSCSRKSDWREEAIAQ